MEEEEEAEGLDRLEIGFSGKTGLRGVFAKEQIEEGEYICAIPFVSTILVDETFVESSSGEGEEEEEEDDSSELLSAGRVGHSAKLRKIVRDGSEKWGAYLDCLPKRDDANFDATPDFWSDEDIRSLEIPSLVESALRRKEELRELSAVEGVDLAELQLASWLVQSRAFTTLKKAATLDPENPDDPAREGLLRRTVLIPFIDFLNHASTSPNAEMKVVETKAYEESFYALTATRKIPEGKEVRIRYGAGKETSWDLFAKYGFVPTDNAANDVAFLRDAPEVPWTTTLEEDEERLEELLGDDDDEDGGDDDEDGGGPSSLSRAARRTALSLRIHIKKLIAKMESE